MLTRSNAGKNLFRFALAVLLVSLQHSAAQDAASKAKAEVSAIQQVAKEHPITDPDLASLNSDIADGLKRASDALNSGQLYLSLERLDAYGGLFRAVQFVQDKSKGHEEDMPGFESEWRKTTVELTALDQPAKNRKQSRLPAAIQAIAEKAQIQAMALADGGRGFALATKPKDGYLYLGQARAEAHFVEFCRALPAQPHGPAFPLRSFLPELHQLQEMTNAAFQPPRSIDLHPQFIRLNSTIKLAGELDAAKLYSGALYQYLDAVQQFALLDATAPDARKQDRIREALANLRRQIGSSKRDDSIAEMFLERAEAALSTANGAAPGETEWKRAEAIAEQVMPAYFAAAKPAARLQKTNGITTTVTLVRWPYT